MVGPNPTFTPPRAAAPARPQEGVDKPLLDGRNQRGRPQQLGQNHSQQDSLHIARKARNSLRKLTQEVGRRATSGETRNPVLNSKSKVLNRVILSPSLAFAEVLFRASHHWVVAKAVGIAGSSLASTILLSSIHKKGMMPGIAFIMQVQGRKA